MCTIGAKILEQGKHYLLFKNKDFGRKNFDDKIIYNEHLFGVRGVESWESSDSSADTFSGISVGINKYGLGCADANIRSYARRKNYDILVQIVLEEAKNIDQAVQAAEKAIAKEDYGWTNLVVVDPHETAVLEVGESVTVERNPREMARTNHFITTPGHRINYSQNKGTKSRYMDASSRLGGVTEAEEVFELLRTHREGSTSRSVCGHGNFSTVYSYVLEVLDGNYSVRVIRGNPCEGKSEKLTLSFRDEDIKGLLKAYPSLS